MQTRSSFQAPPVAATPHRPEAHDVTPSVTEREDLAACRASLRNGSKTFLAASMLLPRGVHEPASALYAFCRLADDAVDAPAGEHAAVARLRERLSLAYAGAPQPHAADRARLGWARAGDRREERSGER